MIAFNVAGARSKDGSFRRSKAVHRRRQLLAGIRPGRRRPRRSKRRYHLPTAVGSIADGDRAEPAHSRSPIEQIKGRKGDVENRDGTGL